MVPSGKSTPLELPGDSDLRHLRPHRGHSGHADAPAVPGSARASEARRRGRVRRASTSPSTTAPSLCMAPNQEMFIAAASQVTKHDPPRPDGEAAAAAPSGPDHRGHVRRRPAHGRPTRLRRRPRRRADRARLVRQHVDGVEGALRGHARASSATRSRPARSRAPEARTTTSRPVPLATKPFQDPIPFWYPGNPVTAGRHGMSLMCAGRESRRAPTTPTSRTGSATGATRSGSTARTADPRVGLHADPRDRAHREGGAGDLAPRRRRARAAHEGRTHATTISSSRRPTASARSGRSRPSSPTSRRPSPPAPACRSRSSSGSPPCSSRGSSTTSRSRCRPAT